MRIFSKLYMTWICTGISYGKTHDGLPSVSLTSSPCVTNPNRRTASSGQMNIEFPSDENLQKKVACSTQLTAYLIPFPNFFRKAVKKKERWERIENKYERHNCIKKGEKQQERKNKNRKVQTNSKVVNFGGRWEETNHLKRGEKKKVTR